MTGRLRRLVGRSVARVSRHRALLVLIGLGLGLVGRLHRHPSWWINLGRVYEARQRFASAAAAYGRAVRLASVPGALPNGRHDYAAGQQVRALVRLRDWPGIARVAAALPRSASISVPLAVALASAYRELGDWPAAADVLRRAMTGPPQRVAVEALVECLELQFSVPFSVSASGELRTATDEERSAAWSEAARWRAWLVEDESWRAGPSHRLGLLYERAGRLAEAADAYEKAMQRLASLDGWWGIRAAHEWAFRLARARDGAGADPELARRLGRAATPAGPRAAQEPAGFFDVLPTYLGLQVEGFLVPGVACAEVEILVDGVVLKRLMVDRSTYRPTLRFEVSDAPLRAFPERALMTIRAAGRPLVTTGGTEALQLRVPNGAGTIADRLAGGASLSKKGGWLGVPGSATQAQARSLDVYDAAREALARCDRPLFLAYGTLLGCYRDREFIKGDDDFDVAYASLAPDPAAFRAECFELALALLREGFDITYSIQGKAFKVTRDGVRIDVTPLWFYRNRAWGFVAHDITLDTVLPVRTDQFLGHTVYLPARPEAFLADTYGPGWRTPEPSFRHFRPPEDFRVLSQMYAKPSELREFARRAEAERESRPTAGRFLGAGHPTYPGLSWLTSPSFGEDRASADDLGRR